MTVGEVIKRYEKMSEVNPDEGVLRHLKDHYEKRSGDRICLCNGSEIKRAYKWLKDNGRRD